MPTLRISLKLYEALRAHGEETYPHECCGIFLGKPDPSGNEVRKLVRAGNTRTDSAHNRYHIAPEDLIRAQREGRQGRGSISSGSITRTRITRRSGRRPTSPKPTGSAAPTSSRRSKTATAAITNSFRLAGPGEEDKKFEDEAIEISLEASSGEVAGILEMERDRSR